MNSPDIIKDASDALQQISDRGITVMQGWYDKDIHETHVTLWDLGEVDENFSDDDAEGVTLSLQVTIFSESDEVELAREIKKLMKEKGFSFEGRNGDDSKPEDGIYMKAQRFSKFYEMEERQTMEKEVTRPVCVQVPVELFEQFKAYLKQHGMTQKDFVIRCIQQALAEDTGAGEE